MADNALFWRDHTSKSSELLQEKAEAETLWPQSVRVMFP